MDAGDAFKQLRIRFSQASVFLHPNFQQPFIIEADASDTATRGILSQRGEDGHIPVRTIAQRCHPLNKITTFMTRSS